MTSPHGPPSAVTLSECAPADLEAVLVLWRAADAVPGPTDNLDALARRLAQAEAELAQQERFDHVLPNVEGDLDATVDALIALIDGERARPGRSPLRL